MKLNEIRGSLGRDFPGRSSTVPEEVYKGETVRLKGQTFHVKRKLRGNQLAKGMIVLAKSMGSIDFYEILGVSDDSQEYGEGGVVYDSVREALQANKVTSLKALEEKDNKNEYGYSHYVFVRSLEDEGEGPWLYLFKGRWNMGSGASTVTFVELSEEPTEYRRGGASMADELSQEQQRDREKRRQQVARKRRGTEW